MGDSSVSNLNQMLRGLISNLVIVADNIGGTRPAQPAVNENVRDPPKVCEGVKVFVLEASGNDDSIYLPIQESLDFSSLQRGLLFGVTEEDTIVALGGFGLYAFRHFSKE